MRHRGIAVALIASGNYLAGTLWPLFLSDVLINHGWRDAYQILSLLSVITIIPLAFLLRRKVPAYSQKIAGQLAQQKSASLNLSPKLLIILLGIAGISCCVAMSMPQVHIVSYCVGLGFGPAVGVQMLSVMLFGGVVSRIVFGFIADRLGGIQTVLLGACLQCIALVMYILFDLTDLIIYRKPYIRAVSGRIVPSHAGGVREYLPPQTAGTQVGFVMMMMILGMALGGWMSGWVYDPTGSYQMAFINGIGWNALNLLIMFWLLSRHLGTKTKLQQAGSWQKYHTRQDISLFARAGKYNTVIAPACLDGDEMNLNALLNKHMMMAGL